MNDLISRQAAIEALRTCYDTEAITYTNGNEYIDYDQALDLINTLPPVQPKRGRWIERNPLNSDKCRLIECDQCGKSYIVGFNVPYEHWIDNRNYCEKCGADMRGEA